MKRKEYLHFSITRHNMIYDYDDDKLVSFFISFIAIIIMFKKSIQQFVCLSEDKGNL